MVAVRVQFAACLNCASSSVSTALGSTTGRRSLVLELLPAVRRPWSASSAPSKHYFAVSSELAAPSAVRSSESSRMV